MAKRKRTAAVNDGAQDEIFPTKKPKAVEQVKPNGAAIHNAASASFAASETIQIVVGSYDQVLHGITATISGKGSKKPDVEFADTFLFNAHSSSIRCVAFSPVSPRIPGQTQKVLLATGSTDERIHVYNISAHPPSRKHQDMLAKVAPRPILENSKNRELGTLLHHSSTVTSLNFPTRSKLLSASDDSTIAVTRTRDWSLLSTVKAPVPKAMGRPSGDTAPFGATPSGVNDFAIHPSMKLMISVSKGERCMRLWNLVTGKKAGVLNFTRAMLQESGEGKHSTGEGRRVVWGNVEGVDEFAVGFERDIVVFDMDSVPKCRVMPSSTKNTRPATSRTKLHKFCYVDMEKKNDGATTSLLAVSTEDGRIMFFSTNNDDLVKQEESTDGVQTEEKLPVAKFVGQIGGAEANVTGRIKDFTILKSSNGKTLYVVGASSDGQVRVWSLTEEELSKAAMIGEKAKGKKDEKTEVAILGNLIGTYETRNRITCVAAFVMIPRPEDAEESEDDFDIESEIESASEDEDSE